MWVRPLFVALGTTNLAKTENLSEAPETEWNVCRGQHA